MTRLFSFVFLIGFAFVSVACSAETAGKTGDLDWWKNAVFYQIYPRSFKDSDNNGVGDLKGIISKLDHLVDAGVTAAWLSPIYKSPQVDHGYDISDFRDVDPLFGNLDDFKQFVREAKRKGIKVILDFVPNHSSNEHEWFGKSERSEPGYEDYYIWLEGRENNKKPPNNWVSYFHGPAWNYSEIRGKWYLHQFAAGQPDLNFRDPRVVQEMKDVLTYWLDLGVDGFRVDTISSLFEVDGYPDEPLSGDPGSTENDYGFLLHPYTNDQPETYDMVYQWRELLDEYTAAHGGDARIMMTESYADIDKAFPFYGNATHDGAHFTFNFFFITRLNAYSKAQDVVNVIHRWMDTLPSKYVPNWVLGNHDQHRLASRYGTKRSDGLIMLTMLLPGVAVTYNGEEIAMENGEVTWEEGQDPQACNGVESDFDKSSRDFQRTPYQWDDSVNAGFNDGGKTWLPVSSKYLQCNLKAQNIAGLRSHYNVYKALLKARKTDVLKKGDWNVQAVGENVLVLLRHLQNDNYVLVENIGGNTEKINLSEIFKNLPENLKVLIPSVTSPKNEGDTIETKAVTLDPYEAVVLTS